MKLSAFPRLVFLASIGILSGCAVSGSQTAAPYHPETEARVRVYWGSTAEFFFNTSCVPKHDPKRLTVSRLGFSSFVNKTVGMPVPSDAIAYFNEYIVPADQPLTVRAVMVAQVMIGTKIYAEKFPREASTFVPQHGHDYEIIVQPVNDDTQISARELMETDSIVSTKPFDITRTHVCQ
jgi:hypothetical protein